MEKLGQLAELPSYHLGDLPEMNDEIGFELFANSQLSPSELREQKRRKS